MTKLMQNMSAKVSAFYRDDEAASAVEYGLLASLIAVAIIIAVRNLGTAVNTKFQQASTGINSH